MSFINNKYFNKKGVAVKTLLTMIFLTAGAVTYTAKEIADNMNDESPKREIVFVGVFESLLKFALFMFISFFCAFCTSMRRA